VLEVLLLAAVTDGAVVQAENRTPSKPSLELLEFLGEFGEDDEGLFEGADPGTSERAPAKDAHATPKGPARPKSPPASPAQGAKDSP